jgi:hypothetical protein
MVQLLREASARGYAADPLSFRLNHHPDYR